MAAQQQASASKTDPASPRASESPAPVSPQGDLELELLGLANALYNLGTTVVNDLTKEKDKPGGGKQVGLRVCVVSLLVTMQAHSTFVQEQRDYPSGQRRWLVLANHNYDSHASLGGD